MTADEKMPPATSEEHPKDEDAMWKVGDRIYAVWASNGCYYAATIASVDPVKRTYVVNWDDKGETDRVVTFAQVMAPNEDTTAWSSAKIDKKASVRNSVDKGRCLFTNEATEPGNIVFVERPLLVALPALQPKLWEHLTKLHEAQPLNLGTVTFHFAALLSQLQLAEQEIEVILDKFVPDPDEDAGEDVIRILQSIQENDILDTKEHPINPRRLQRLVSAWRYNSFGHHKEDGLVLYNRISMCAHSCDPSCCWSYGEDDAFVLRARIALHKDSELTISYLQDEDLLKSTQVRQTKLQNWRFTCACPRCKLVIDAGRGFKCRKCRVGIMFATSKKTLEPCHVCTSTIEAQDLLSLEEEYVTRVENLDKTDVEDVKTVYQAALEIFERHWILYVMDTMLWEAYREKALLDAVEHQRRRIEFHEHYYCRPTFILAWCHEELADSFDHLSQTRRWQVQQEYSRAYHMLMILCGPNHQYTASPYNKLCNTASRAEAAQSSAQQQGGGTTYTQTAGSRQ